LHCYSIEGELGAWSHWEVRKREKKRGREEIERRRRRSESGEREDGEGARSHESKRERKKEGGERVEMKREKRVGALGPMRARESRRRGEEEE
jgi:hypothetical protein